MKKFVYQVKGFEFVDNKAFGTAWQEAKAKAAELHTAVYRLVINGDDVRQEVFCTGGCFLSVESASRLAANLLRFAACARAIRRKINVDKLENLWYTYYRK